MTPYLLIVTEDGFGKRVAVDEIRRTKRRGGVGVTVSRVCVVAARVVEDGELVIGTRRGIVQRVPLSSIRVVRRSDPTTGRVPKGVRVIRLDAGDAVASVAYQAAEGSSSPCLVETRAPEHGDGRWPGGRVGLRDGESVRSVVVLTRVLDVAEHLPGGTPTTGRDEWAQTDVHAVSSYWCVHCERQHADPHAVYECIDRHALEAAQPDCTEAA